MTWTAAVPSGATGTSAVCTADAAASAAGTKAGACAGPPAVAAALPPLPLASLGSGGLPPESGTLPVLDRREVPAGVKASCFTGKGEARPDAAASAAGALCCLS